MPGAPGGRTLLVRHLPAELSLEEQRELLQQCGAETVRRCAGRGGGREKHAAFATFQNEFAAGKALSRLHQLTVLGHTLVVEYAKESHVHLPDQPPFSEKSKSPPKADEKKEVKPPNQITIERGIAPNHGLAFPIRSSLKYLYPPPTNTVLTNIANALASVPKFYVQVLHLMNKLNLPAPFGPLTAHPPLYAEHLAMPTLHPPIPSYPPENPPLPELDDDYDMEVSSREESEYDSADEDDKERVTRLKELSEVLPKAKRTTKPPRPRKKIKLKDLLNVPVAAQSHAPLLPADVFEQPHNAAPKKIEFHLPTDMPPAPQREDGEEPAPERDEDVVGFGKIYPAPAPKADESEEEEEEDDMPLDFISRRELEKWRLTKEEMRKLSVFKNYDPGDPNCRLYVKNLSKQVDEKDLKFIFGRFVNFSSETEKIMFDIRLMKEGRMKGQAFVGFPSEDVAAKALKQANGYVLHDKPMVIQFARSARPKPNAKDTQKKR